MALHAILNQEAPSVRNKREMKLNREAENKEIALEDRLKARTPVQTNSRLRRINAQLNANEIARNRLLNQTRILRP